MSEEQNDVKGLESGIDADAGIGPSAEELETHNPDEMDFDQVLKDIESFNEDEEETTGESEKTDESEDEKEAGTKDKEKEEEAEQTVPYSRFKEVNDKFRESERVIARMEGRLEAMERAQQVRPQEPVEVKPLPLQEILSNDPQAILDAFQENPAEFLGHVIQAAKFEATTEMEERGKSVAMDNRIKAGLDAFVAEHDDFLSQIDRIGEVIQKNPIHNAVSAYAYEVEIPSLKSQLSEMEGKVEAAKNEGVKEGRKQVIAEIKAKGAASLLDGSASTQSKTPVSSEGIETGGDPQKLREQITQELLKKRAAS